MRHVAAAEGRNQRLGCGRRRKRPEFCQGGLKKIKPKIHSELTNKNSYLRVQNNYILQTEKNITCNISVNHCNYLGLRFMVLSCNTIFTTRIPLCSLSSPQYIWSQNHECSSLPELLLSTRLRGVLLNRPGVAGVVLQTALWFSNWLMVWENVFMAPPHPIGWKWCMPAHYIIIF